MRSQTHFQKGQRIRFGFVLFLFVCLGSVAVAQRPNNPEQLAVDEVKLKSGERLYGIVTEKNNLELTLFVERAWLEDTYPKFYKDHLNAEEISFLKEVKVRGQRLEQWKRERMLDETIIELVESEEKRFAEDVEKAKDKGDVRGKRFTIIKIQSDDVKATGTKSRGHHQVAGAAWKHNVDRVTTRTLAALKRELLQKNVDYKSEVVDFSGDVPTLTKVTDEEWFAKVALFEFALLEPCEFQGIGSNLVRIDRNEPANANDVIQQFLGGGMGGIGQLGGGGLIDELMNELKLDGGPRLPQKKAVWWKKAASIAEKEGFRGFKATKLVQNMMNPVVTVEVWFVAEVANGKWKPVLVARAAVNRNEVDAADVERVKVDPQVESVLKLAEKFQLGNGNVRAQALRHGAATDLAIKDAEGKFQELLDRHTDRTDGPPLKVK